MKDLSIAVAASILTVFAFAPGLSARTAGAANRDFAAKSEKQSSVAKSIVIAQLSPGMSMNQGEILEAQQNADNPGDDGSSADTDNQTPDDTDQNTANADQNGDPNNPDADQNAQADDNGDNSDQGNGEVADAQADNGETADQNADNSTAAQ